MHRVPSALDDEGKRHWRKHYQHAVDNGSLTDATVDSFQLMCHYWSLILKTDPESDGKAAMRFVMYTKYYMSLAVVFGLLAKNPPPPKQEKQLTIADILRGESRAA